MATGFKYGAKAVVTVAATDLSAYTDDGELSLDIDTAETTTWGSTYKSFIEGLAASKFTLKGAYDPTATTGPAAKLTGLIGGGAVTVVYNPAGTVSTELKRTFSAILTSYSESSPVGGRVSFAAAFQGTGAVTFAAN